MTGAIERAESAGSESPPGAGAPQRIRTLTHSALLTAQVGQALTFVMLSAILPQIALYFGGGAQGELIAQQMAVFPFLGLTAGGFLSGSAIRLLGLRRTVLGSAAAYALSGAVPLIATTALPMLTASFALGLSASLLTSAVSGVAGELYSSERLAKLVSYQVALAIFTGALLGFLAALAVQQFGWRAPFAVYVAAGLVIFALNLVGLPNARWQQEQAEGTGAVIRANWPVYVLGFLSFIIITLQPTYLPFLMTEKGIESSAARAGLLTISTGASFFGSVTFSQLQGRLAPARLRNAAMALLAIAFILYASWGGAVSIMICALACAGFGGGMIIPALFGAALARTPHAGAQSVGFLNVSIFAGSFLTPYLLALPRQAFGIQPMLGIVCGLILAGGVVGYVLDLSRRGKAATPGQ